MNDIKYEGLPAEETKQQVVLVQARPSLQGNHMAGSFRAGILCAGPQENLISKNRLQFGVDGEARYPFHQ